MAENVRLDWGVSRGVRLPRKNGVCRPFAGQTDHQGERVNSLIRAHICPFGSGKRTSRCLPVSGRPFVRLPPHGGATANGPFGGWVETTPLGMLKRAQQALVGDHRMIPAPVARAARTADLVELHDRPTFLQRAGYPVPPPTGDSWGTHRSATPSTTGAER